MMNVNNTTKIALVTGSSRGLSKNTTMKGGIEVLTRYLAKELGSRQIAVNTIASGAIETDFAGGAVRDTSKINDFIASQTALGRVGEPDDIGVRSPLYYLKAIAG